MAELNIKGRSFLTLKDFTPEEIEGLLDLAAKLKDKKKRGIFGTTLARKNIALIFEKPFVVLAQKDMPDLSRYVSLLELLELEERIVYMTDDFRTKEYLFRKPVRYNKVSGLLDKLRTDSYNWLKNMIGGEE